MSDNARALTVVPNRLDVTSVGDIQTLGQLLAKSGYFADARDMAQAVVKIMAGQELGIAPIAAMTGIHIIKGKVTLSANVMASVIKRSGRYNYRVRTLTDQAADVEFFESGKSVGASAFTIDEAKRAGLLENPTWRSYPRNMLFARALSNGAKWFCPDLFAGPVYTPDELDASVPDEVRVVGAVAPEDATEPVRRPAVEYETFEVVDAPTRPAPVVTNQPVRAATNGKPPPPNPAERRAKMFNRVDHLRDVLRDDFGVETPRVPDETPDDRLESVGVALKALVARYQDQGQPAPTDTEVGPLVTQIRDALQPAPSR